MKVWPLTLCLACAPGPVAQGTGGRAGTDSGAPAPLVGGPGVLAPEADACPEGCDDGDPCTVDTCDRRARACVYSPWAPSRENLFDVEILQNEQSLNLEVLSEAPAESDPSVTLRELRFDSVEITACVSEPIRLQAWLALPAVLPAPGVVIAHGMGAMGDPDAAVALAANLGVVALAYSGPGMGESEGRPSDVDNLFRTTPDPRESWFWAHDAAAMRALTVLEASPEVDPSRLAMTGTSAGALAALTAAGVDDRLDAIVPVSGAGWLDLAAEAGGWMNALLAAVEPPLDADSEQWASYEAWLDPKNFVGSIHASTLLAVGAQDEFFPITSAAATAEALAEGSGEARALHIADWDHGWFSADLCEAAEATVEASRGVLLVGALGLAPSLETLPPSPEVVSVAPWTCEGAPCAWAEAELPEATTLSVSEVEFAWSLDGFTWGTAALEADGEGWSGPVAGLDAAAHGESDTAWFVSFTFEDPDSGRSFTLTSVAHVPDGFVPTVLPAPGS